MTQTQKKSLKTGIKRKNLNFCEDHNQNKLMRTRKRNNLKIKEESYLARQWR